MAYQTREFTTAGDDPAAMVEVTFDDGSPKKVFTAAVFAELEPRGEGALKAYQQPEEVPADWDDRELPQPSESAEHDRLVTGQ